MTISATNVCFSVMKRLAYFPLLMSATSSSDVFCLCSILRPFQGCPAGSIQSSLEVTLSYEGVETDLYLYVEEPSDMRVSTFDKGASHNLRQRKGVWQSQRKTNPVCVSPVTSVTNGRLVQQQRNYVENDGTLVGVELRV